MLEPGHISVNGVGTANGTPDQCRLQIALNHMADSAADALSGTSEMASRAIAALTRLTSENDEVHTMGLSVQEFYDQATQKVTAHVGSYRMDVLVRPIERAGEVLSGLAATVGDGFQVRGIDLSLQDPETLKSQARRMAVQDAKRRAVEMTDEAGVKLGDLISIEDENSLAGNGRRAIPMSSAYSGAHFPIEGGNVSMVSAVTLTYAIER